MTDRMDVDSDAMPDDTHLKDKVQRMQRSSGITATIEQGDLMELPESKQEGLVAPSHEGLGGRDPKETRAYKQKTSFLQQIPSFIGLAPRSREGQTGSDITNVEDLRARLEAQRKNNEILEKIVNNAGSKVELLKSQIESSRNINAELRQENQDHLEEIVRLMESHEAMGKVHEAEKQAFLEKIAQLNDQIKTLTSTSDQLRQMLVPISEKQVLDSDVVFMFTSLRSSIIGLVRQTWKPAFKGDADLRQLSTNQRDVFSSCGPISYDLIRFVVFDFIYGVILGPQRYFLDDGFEKLENNLRKAEREFNKSSAREDRGRAMQWRDATFKATESFRGNGQNLSSSAQSQIWNFLGPLQTKDAAAEETGKTKLKAICDNAVELSLMIRQMKDDFSVHNLFRAHGQPLSHWDEWAEETLSVRGPNDVESGTIVFAIHGALVKSPKEDFERVLVLEKAEVAVYE